MGSEPLHSAASYEGERATNPRLRGKARVLPASVRWERMLLAAWFVANVAIGVLTVHQYGVSYDEPNNYRYAADTLSGYKTFFGILAAPPYNPSYDGHGPAFVAGALVLIRAIQGVFPNVFQPDLWHFSYFVAFQLTGLCLYLLMKRWFQAWTAWGILILFDTQPLLLGHAFINPKDIPFMFFFTLSILLGFRLADGVEASEQFVSLRAPLQAFTARLRGAESRRARRFFIALGVAVAAALLLIVLAGPVNTLVGQAVRFFYRAEPGSWAGQVFSLVASHAAGLTAKDYVSKGQRVFQLVERGALLAGVLLFAAWFCVIFPAELRAAWEQRRKLRAVAAGISKLPGMLRQWLSVRSLKQGLGEVLKALRQPRLIVAGLALGVAGGIRAIAPWAGVIAFVTLFAKVRSKAWATGIAYFLVTGIVTYMAWPRLWGAPLQRYVGGLGTISNFVDAQHVLFNGRVYPATGLPRSYIFTLMNIQFSEPLLLCVYIGLAVLAWQLLRGKVRSDLLLYIGLAFGAPLVAWEVLGSPLYDNFRHLLFVIPAMFMLAALTLEAVFRKLNQNWVRVVVIAAIALPGVYSSVTLYPYEYNYYNSLVGGVAGASKLYSMDPWRTSLREVALALNERAPYGAKVLAGDWAEIISLYARPDLRLETTYSEAADLNGEYDYAVEVPNVKPWSLHHDTEEVFMVRRDGAVLGLLKAVNNATTK